MKHTFQELYRLVRGSLRRRHDDIAIIHTQFHELVLRQKTRLASGIAEQDAALLGRLDKALVVASDSVADRDKVKVRLVKDIPVLRREFQKALRQAIVVRLLLDRVIERRVFEVLFTIGNEEMLEL